MQKTYLDWVAERTATTWWHDSADPVEVDRGRARGAVGATTNPVLVAAAFDKNGDRRRA